MNAHQKIKNIDYQIENLIESKKLLLIIDFFDKLKEVLILSKIEEIILSISRQESDFKPVYNGFYINYNKSDDYENYEASRVFEKFNMSMPNKWYQVSKFCTLPENVFVKITSNSNIEKFLQDNFESKFYKQYFNQTLLEELGEKKTIKKQLKI